MRDVLLIDGNNNFIRHYVVNPTMDDNGNPIGGMVGLLKNVRDLLTQFEPDLAVMVWDGEGGSARRRSIYSEYKAGRKVKLNRELDVGDAKDHFENMVYQLRLARKYLNLLGVMQVCVDGCEADDVIAYLSTQVMRDDVKTIVSTDRDFLQLVGSNTVVFNPIKKLVYNDFTFKDEYGILPENYIFVKALHGDASDNIKGIRGLGPKTIAKLFPAICERPVTLQEIFSTCETNLDKSPKYQAVLGRRELVIENVKLMQLATPLITPAAARSIRAAIEEHPGLRAFDFNLAHVKDGIKTTDRDIVSVFKAYHTRRKFGGARA